MDELEISGKRYISTRRAAKEHKYHSDYIGQLIRAKKVDGQKVGRSWYVVADSLAEYLGKEVSAKPVKEIVAEKIETMKGEESKKIEETPTPQETAGRGSDQSVGVEDEVEDKDAYHIPLKINNPEIIKTRNNLRYLADDAPLYPLERPVKPQIKLRPVEVETEETVYVEDEPVIIERPQTKKSLKSFVLRGGVVLAAGVVTLSVVAAASTLVVATTTVKEQQASVSYSLHGL